MGAADVVPGVSGGTIAFITGIYDELLDSIKRLGPGALKVLAQEGVVACWKHINGAFLLTLGSGILLSLFSLAKVISGLLVTHPIPLWSFFTGLILVSVWHMLRQLDGIKVSTVVFLIAGAVLAWWISGMTPRGTTEPELPFLFVCGAVAICAMILPGISGSFLLLLLGVYQPVLTAVATLDIPVLATVASGCIIGLLLFTRFLSWLLACARHFTLAFLTGLMLGSVNKLWPWKQATADQVVNVLPQTYEQLTGLNAQLSIALAMGLCAIVMVLAIERMARRLTGNSARSEAAEN